MGFSAVTYALSKKYTEGYVQETAEQFGALKGASCQIKSIVKQNGRNEVTFEWVNSEGETRESLMYVDDGTPIYVWESGNTYKYGDLVIYASAFYRCIIENSDMTFDDTKWNEIGSPDGNYDIVQNKDYLPARFTAADRKMYYSIEEETFYLWNGIGWIKQNKIIQFNSMPVPKAIFSNVIVQYIGTTNVSYTNGYFYKCELIDSQYWWNNIDVQSSSTVAKTGNYNDLTNRPIIRLVGESDPIIISELDDGFYSIIGSYCYYQGDTINIAIANKYFVVENNANNVSIIKIEGNGLKRYTYSSSTGLAEERYATVSDIGDYITANEATQQDIENLFSI